MALQASCPACGAQVTFKTGSSVVVVCEFCHSVVARTDRGFEDLGKVSDVVDSGSPLEVGLSGVFLGVATFNLYCCRERGEWPWAERLGEMLGAAEVSVRSVSRETRASSEVVSGVGAESLSPAESSARAQGGEA